MDATILRSFQIQQFSRSLLPMYTGHVKPDAAKPWRCARQSSKMAALLNSLSFAFKYSFLPKYSVKYYDYIVKWCSGIQCNWYVSMDTVYAESDRCCLERVLNKLFTNLLVIILSITTDCLFSTKRLKVGLMLL